MGLKNIKLITSFILINLFWTNHFSQVPKINFDSTITKIFTKNLNTALIKTNKPIVFVSTTNCIGCVNYFSNFKNKFIYLFSLHNESLIEISRIIDMYKLKKETVYFTTSEHIKTNINNLCRNPSPIIILKKQTAAFLIDYESTSKLTEDFTLDSKKLYADLKKLEL